MITNVVRIVTQMNQKNGMFGKKLTHAAAQKELFRILKQPQIVEVFQRMKNN